MTNKEGVVDAGSSNPAQTAVVQNESDGNASFLRAARAGNIEKVLEYLKGSIDINTSNANGLNALHLASKEGHVSVVTELVKRGANVNAATKKGNTALHIASLAGQEEVVKILIRNGANVNVQSQNGFTPLYMAAQENHDNVVKFLLANGANQSLATEDGFTPLAVALQQGHDKVVAVLLENDAKGRVRLPALHIAAKKDDCKAAALLLQNDHDPDVTSKSGFTPLHIAAHYGNENIGKLLLEKNADVNYSAKHQITPLHVAAKWGKANMVSLLVEKGAKIDASTRDGLTPLHCAARSGHDQVVDLLLEKGGPITAKTKNGLAPLHMASQGDHVDGARILLYHKAPVDDVTVDYLTALHVAAHCGHVRVAKLLLDRKADPNARALNGFTPLHIACKKNRIKVVELLLKHGASIEATTESGLTPLHVASFMGCMNIVIYLIQHGANPDVPTVRGETPLHLAARANQSDIIRILLRNGAHVDASAREQQTPLHIAARLGNVDIVGLLLQHGAAVDAPTKDMYTALHIAAKEGQEEVASVLLDHGASLTSTTKKGFTPLHLAAKYGNIKVARLLLQKDAPVDSQGKNGVTPLHVAAHYDHVNVALLLLDKGAYPHATAKNGYTPLHIAAKKNQMDIATTLLEYGAKSNAESKAGFTPLHLASQEGHTDMTTLLIEHHADANAAAKNGLTPIHLCSQEDRVNVAAILVKNGSDIGPQTKAGYTPLHVACHFGQINMIRFLLQHGADVNATTSHGYTPLHQAAQQGHTLIINLLLEHKASPNTTTSQGQTALSIAQRLGYVSVVETLKIVTETVVTTTTTTVTEEKYKVVVPETMHETFMSDSEDEGGDDIEDTSLYGKPAHATHVYLPYIEGQRLLMTEDTMLGDQSFRYLTADEMKSLGDDSLPIDVTRDERGMDSMLSAPLTAEEDHLTPQHMVQQEATFSSTLAADNIDLTRAPIHAGKLKWKTFLVSFMVDARGGAMRGCRHSGVRVIIPPRKAPMPMRITCRYLRKEKLSHPPPLMEGEACASRILEVGPAGAKFLGPVIIEVPHFAALRGREREITILRSDNGESWREHTLEASDDAVHDVFNESFEGEELNAVEDLNTNRITRILTTDFPQYFALITRIRQEVHAIGPEGGMVSSTVVPQVQAIFPEGALTKKIKVGLQAQPITPELVTKMLGNRVAVSPIVTVEPRRRKFHKPITLTIPVPQAATKGMINQYSGDAPTLRLLCSITGSTKTGGTTKAQWEDVTGSTPLTFVNDCVSFTTTVSARFWLMDCRQVNEATKFATELYREAIHVPFMAKFVVFAKRHDPLEAQLRVFCMTDDKEDKTLESQEHFSEVAKSRDVEVLEAKYQFLEFAGNLVPVTKSGEQLSLTFQAFRENRLPFTIRVKDPHQEPLGRVAFMREARVGRGEPPQTPICNLNIALPEAQLTPVSELVTLEKKYGFVEETGLANPELIHRADLRLSDIAKELRADWVPLALQLDVPETDINSIRSECPDNVNQQALIMLRHWLQRAGSKATGNSLEKALRKINREDIVNQCMFNVELVTDDVEKAVAKVHLDQSGFDTFKEELGSSRDTSLRRDASLNGTLDDRDIMKEAESAAETSSESSDKEGHHLKHEAESFQLTAEPERSMPEVKEVVVIREVVNKSEATLVELSPAKSKSEGHSDSNAHDLSNGLPESSIQEDDKSDPTTAVSSEATAEFEISSTDEKPDGETHTERKDRPANKTVPAAKRKAQKLLLNSLKKTGPKEQSKSLRYADEGNKEKDDGSKATPRSPRLTSKRVSFDISYHTMSPPILSQKKKKPLVRRGSWPPVSIPGQRSRKKKQKKYMKAIKTVDILSLRSESTPILKNSYEWLLLNDEPEPFTDIPLAKCDELEETNWNDPSSLQMLVSCKPAVPCLKKTIAYEEADLIINPSVKSKNLPSKNSCQFMKNSLQNNSNDSEISCPSNEFMAQELARLSKIQEKIHRTQRIASIPQIPAVGEYRLSSNEMSSFLNSRQAYDNFQSTNILDFGNYESFVSSPNPIQNFQPNNHDFPPIPIQNDDRNNAISNPKSILKRDSVDNLFSNQNKNIIKDSKFTVKSTPQDIPGSKPQSSSKSQPQSSTSSSSDPRGKSQSSHDSTEIDSSSGMFSGSTDTTETLIPSIASGSTEFSTIQKENEDEDSTKKGKTADEKEGSDQSLVGEIFLRRLSEQLQSCEKGKDVPASVIGQAFLKTLLEQQAPEPPSKDKPIPSSVVSQVFLKSLTEPQSPPETEETLAPASVVSQMFLKSLMEQQPSEISEEKPIPAPAIGHMFLKALLEQQPSEVSSGEKLIPASVVGQSFLKALAEQPTPELPEGKVNPAASEASAKSVLEQQSTLQERSIPGSVIGQTFLKSLMADQPSQLTTEEELIPASVLCQSFLKFLVEQQPADSTSKEKIIPASVVEQSFLKSLMEQQSPDTHKEEERVIPASAVGQAFLKSILEQQSADTASQEKVIPAPVVGQTFLKSLVEQSVEQPHSEEKIISAAAVGQAFLKSIMEQQSADSASKERPIPASVVGQTFLKSLFSDQSPESTVGENPIPASVVGQSFLRSLVEQQSKEALHEEAIIPASVIEQLFLKSLVEQQVSDASGDKKPIPASAVGQAFLKSMLEQQSTASALEEKPIPASVIGQLFLKSLASDSVSKSESGEKLIPAPVIGQTFLKSLQEQQSSDISQEEKLIPASVLGHAFLKSIVEKQSADLPSEGKSIPASVVGLTFLKSLLGDQPTESTVEEKAIPASVVGQSFLKTLAEQQSGNVPEEKLIPAFVLGQSFLKSILEQQSTQSTAEEKSIPASVIEQSFLKSLLEMQPPAESASEEKLIPSSVVGLSFLKSLAEQQSSDIPKEGEKTIPASAVGQAFLKSLLEQKVDSASAEKCVPAPVIGQAFLKALIADQASKSAAEEKPIPASVVRQAFLKSLMQPPSMTTPFVQSPSSDVPKEEKTIPASVLGQAFLKSIIEQQSTDSTSKEKFIPASVVGQSFLKSLMDQQSSDGSEEKPVEASMANQEFCEKLSTSGDLPQKSVEPHSSNIASEEKIVPASVVGQAFLKTLAEQQPSARETIVPSDVVGQAFLKSLIESQGSGHKSDEKVVPASVIGQAFLKTLSGESISAQLSAEKQPIPSSVIGQSFLKSLTEQPQESMDETLIPFTVLGQCFLKSLLQKSDSLDTSNVQEASSTIKKSSAEHLESKALDDPVLEKSSRSPTESGKGSEVMETKGDVTTQALSVQDHSKDPKPEWTETDESGGMKQVTQIKTETSIKVVGGKEVPCNDEELLSFVEKRNFFQRLSLTSDNTPSVAKWTQEVSLDDIPMAQGEIINEQISFEDRLKMFEHDEENFRKKVQKNGKQDQPTVYRYDFTKSGKEKVPTPSDLEKAEAIVKKVNDELVNEGDLISVSVTVKQSVVSGTCSLETAEQEVSTLLAEVNREEQCDDIEEIAESIISSENLDTGVSAIEIDDSDDFGLDERRMSDGAFIESPQSEQDGENLADLGYHEESNLELEDSLSIRECSSSPPRRDSLEQSEPIVEEIEEKVTTRTCHVEERILEDNFHEDSSVTEASGQRAATVSPFTLEELHEEGTVCRDYRRESFREALELEAEDKSELKTEPPKSNLLKELPIQNLDISAVVKSQILNEELGQCIEDSPLEVKHIAEEFEKAAVSSRQGEVYKHIKTEIFTQELGEDIESGSPEHKDISPVNPSVDVSEIFATEIASSKTTEAEEDINKHSTDDKVIPVEEENKEAADSPDFQPLSPTENIEHDDLEEYEEARDEHSLSEQLLALASNVSQPVKCITDDDFLDGEGSSNAIFDPSMSHRSSACRKGKEVGYSKKEIRSFKTTKQVSTIEEHSSIESSDSPQELFHHDFSENHLNSMGVKVSGDQDVLESADCSLVPDDVHSKSKEDEETEVPLTSNLVSKVDDVLEESQTDLPHVSVSDNQKSDSESPEDNELPFKKSDDLMMNKQTFGKPQSPPNDSKSSKGSKKSDSDNEASKLPFAELLAPTKKDESFSSSGDMESHYYSAETSDSGKTPQSTPKGSRPCSSEFEANVLSGQGSEYETCVTSQDGTGELSGTYSTAATSQETSYSTACSSFSHSSRESAYSVDSESSGHLASVEISSEASETLVPSAQEMELEFATEFEMPVLDEEASSAALLREPYDMEIPESVIRSGVELPFLKNWDLQTNNQSESMGETSQWPWHCSEQSDSFGHFGSMKPTDRDDTTPLIEGNEESSGMFPLPSTDHHAESSHSSQSSSFIQQSFRDSSERKDSNTNGKHSEKSGSGRAHSAFPSETQSLKHAHEVSLETSDAADSGSACVEEEQLSVSENSATHSEQTWQTSSLDTAVQISGHVPVSCVVLETQAAASFTDSLSDIPPEVGTISEQVPVTSEHQMPYLQLNGPIEIDYNPEYDAFDGDDAAVPENPPQLDFQVDELQFELEEENDVPEDHNAIANGIAENGIEPPHDDINEEDDDDVDAGYGDDFQGNDMPENGSTANGMSACVSRLSEAEKPEAQQEQEVRYQEHDDNLRSENVAFQDQTSYLPESDQENVRSLASESFEQEPSALAQGTVQEVEDQAIDNDAAVGIKISSEPKACSSDSVDKAEVVDTFPEDERYDCLFQKPETSSVKTFHSSDISETNDLLESDTGVYLGSPSDLYTHQEEDDMELKESDMFPSPIPEESKQSTPSFDALPGRKFFPRSGDTSAASSLQEFERLEADIAAGRCSRTSADSLEKATSGKSLESEDLARRMLHRSGETSAASSLQEFERLEADIAAGRHSRASLDSYEKPASGKSLESDYLARRMIHRSEENSTASSLQEFERLEAEIVAGRISRSSAESVEKPATGKSSEHDDVSMSSLADFEKLEKEFSEQEQTSKICKEESIISEVDKGLESQISETKLDCPNTDQDQVDSDDSEYEKRMTEMEECIKLAQTNVEKFHEETVEDLSEGLTYEEYTVTHTSDSSQKYTTDTDMDTVANALEMKAKKGEKNSDETELHTDSSAADAGAHDDSSNSSKNGKADCMLSSTDSVDPSSSTATHATYQFETDSVMSSSINSAQASGEECTMVSSTDTLELETKLTYSQGELGNEDNANVAGGIVSESSFVQVSSYEFPCDIADGLDKPQEMEMFLSNLTHKSTVPDDHTSELVSSSLHSSSSMPPTYPDHHQHVGNRSSGFESGEGATSAEMSGLCQQDDGDGDDDVVSHTTTTTTRIVTTVTTDEGVTQEEEAEGGDELRRSMEEVLNQFMTEDKTQDSQKH